MKNVILTAMCLVGMTVAHAQSLVVERSSHVAAAEELMIVMNMEQTVNEGMSQMVDLQVKNNPALKNKKQALKAFLIKNMGWEALTADYLKMYADEFSEAELKDMTAFYRTETGKKFAAKQIILTMKVTQLSQEKMEAYMPELIQLMQ